MQTNQKEYNEKPVMYAIFYPGLREIAMEHGYALALHGTICRDLDLIAVPWVDEPKPVFDMLIAMADKLGGDFADKDGLDARGYKPHGRKAYIIHTGSGGFIDISVMPTLNVAEYKFIGDELLVSIISHFPESELACDEDMLLYAFYSAKKHSLFAKIISDCHFTADGIHLSCELLEGSIAALENVEMIQKFAPEFKVMRFSKANRLRFDEFIAPKLSEGQLQLIKELSKFIYQEIKNY